MYRKIVTAILVLSEVLFPAIALAQANFDPQFIISDQELGDYQAWTRNDVQQFLVTRGSYLKNYSTEDASGTIKTAADIIYDASQRYKINPKYILVTLQKEQSLITDDAPTTKQLSWATGYAVCDSCGMDDSRIQKYKGFGKQVDNAAGIMRWYYENQTHPIVKKKDSPITIDNQLVQPQSWATAFLYTYTPHLHGNQNFWRIWNTWFDQVYPNGTLLVSASTKEYWLIQNGQRRKFRNKAALISRADPKNAITISEVDLGNYVEGGEIAFSNYTLLRADGQTYMVDGDTLRPFASDQVVAKLGFNPQEIDDVAAADIAGYQTGSTITTSTVAVQGVIYNVPELKSYYFLKDNTLYPVVDKAMLTTQYKGVPIEKHAAKDLKKFTTAEFVPTFPDGTLVKTGDNTTIYVIDQGKKRAIADEDTFLALGYKHSNVVTALPMSLLAIPSGEGLYLNASLLSSKNKFLADAATDVADLYTSTTLAAYLVAEYPSGRIVSGKNIDVRRPIASLTKVLTLNEALANNFKLKGTTVYDPAKYASEGTALSFGLGDKITNKDVFYAVAVVSNNSAARMIAQGTGLSEAEFIDKINRRLEEWGADNTTISDVTGLDEQNKSTARDLLKIFTKVLNNETIKVALAQTTYPFTRTPAKGKVDKRTLHNTNQIIAKIPLSKRSYKVVATKTGYTDEALATLLMLIEDKKTKKQYIVVTLGNPDYKNRFTEPHNLAQWITTTKLKLASP